jgi:transcriptional regulator with XRE-family HTH domain
MHASRKFEALLNAYRRPDGSMWTGQQIQEATDGFVSRSYVTQLRKGRIANPRLDKLQALAEVMGFPPQLWFEDVSDPGGTPRVAPPEQMPTIPERLESLLRSAADGRSGEPYSDADVARLSMGELTEREVTGIRTGAIPDPSMEQVLALAEVFAIEPSYFLDTEAKAPLLDRASLEALSSQKARIILHKSLELSDREQDLIIDMINRLEGLHGGDDRHAQP